MEVQRDDCVIIRSEHHGDASPGAGLLVTVEDITALKDELRSKNYKYSKLDINETEWGSYEMGLKDPFGNLITFQEYKPDAQTM